MNILVINNHSRHLPELKDALTDHNTEIRNYRPGLDFNCEGKDVVILSGGGGEGLEINDKNKLGHLWYEDQMKFVKTCQKPVIGICMGFEVIAQAFGSKVEKMSQGIERFMEFETNKRGAKFLGETKLNQFEGHDWCVKEAPADFEVLAQSETGIEIIKHKTRPMIGIQFHPEKGGTLNLKNIITLTA